MDLHSTLQHIALQLKNKNRTLKQAARVFQKTIKTLYFQNAETRRPGPNPNCPDADILTVTWLLEYIGEKNKSYSRSDVAISVRSTPLWKTVPSILVTTPLTLYVIVAPFGDM